MKKLILLLGFFTQICFGQVNLNLGLRAYYPFTGNANDISGNNNNPVFNNATLTNDRFGNPNSAYHFNGVNSYIQIANNPTINTTNQISLCVWVKPMGFYYGTCHGNSIIMKGDQDYLPGNYLLRFDEALYSPGTGCNSPLTDTIHQNFRGGGGGFPSGPYTPYINKNQWHSVIFTYDGTMEKLYVDCQLKYSVASSVTFTNAYDLFFGRLNSAAYPYWFNGDLDEVRIYDRAINTDEVKVLGGCPSSALTLGGIVNDYTPVLAFNQCNNKITVENATAFNVGDTILMIQMKGAAIDSSNTAAFGTITNYKNAGNYEFNYIKSKAGNIIELENILTRAYDIPTGKVQLIRVPYYSSANITSTLTCLPWDGNKGGVLVVNVRDTLELNADINTSGMGFRKGTMHNSNINLYTCDITDYYWPDNTVDAAGKGEGISFLSTLRNSGKGPAANGGGGGMNTNSGGGGGGNGSKGGRGGNEWNLGCPNYLTISNWGYAGNNLSYNNASNKIFMGGGGGAGHCNNQFDDPSFNADYNGGNGGALIIINTDYLKNNNRKIISKGDSAYQPIYSPTYVTHDGMGAGGAGGTILLNSNNYINNLNIDVTGGKGANLVADVATPGYVGPGGGGSGGVVWVKQNSIPATVNITNNGGANGVIVQAGNIPYGAAAGQQGINVFSLTVPVDIVAFKKNIDSVRIKDSATACLAFDLKGLAYTNTSPINSWQWFYGDGGTANTQNTSHTYATIGSYTVKLVVTDINGCMDSITKTVNVIACSGPIGNIINDYTPVLAFNQCDNKITVENATAFNVGDTILMIQMKGAVIDSSNTAAFGTITDYKNAGNYEFNYVKSKAGNIIELKNILTRAYDIPTGKVQLIRVPYYSSANVTSTLTCLPWDGNKGGVLVVNVRDTLELNADINTTGKGFSKGKMHNSNFNGYTCDITDFYWPDNTIDAAGKGEGITFLSSQRNSGKGPAANGGGGGMNTNSGGGGGSNGNIGGRGGYEYNNGCPNYLTSQNWGYPGNLLTYNTVVNKVFMGGGGGAGHCNDQYDDPSFNADYNGGNGGALIIINADYIKNNSKKIISKGDSAYQPIYSPTYVTHDGMGAGGAGGTVLLNSNNYINTLAVDVSGGKGANLVAEVAAPGYVGPGGGGGGGVVWVKQNSIPANVNITNTGGANGVIVLAGNIPYGAAPGLPGINVFSLAVPVDAIPFVKNIDSVRFRDSATTCLSIDFKGLAYINSSPINTWQWYFGDGGTAITQNTSHTYAASGTYPVKLIVTDINGCKDSILRNVTTGNFIADAGNDTAVCSNGPVVVTLHASAGSSWNWTPAIYLNNATLQNPTATISTTTRFYVTINNSLGCSATDSVTVFINPLPVVKTLDDTAVCKRSVLVLTTTNGFSSYHWSPGIYVSDSTISNPLFIDTLSRTLYITATNVAGCSAKDTINITIKPLPAVKTIDDTLICSTQAITLVTTGAQTYSWSPVIYLSNPNIASPVFSGPFSQIYTVTGTGANGCKAKDTVSILVNAPNSIKRPPDKMLCTKETVMLDGYNGNLVKYLWSPSLFLNDSTIINPIAFPPVTTPFTVVISDKACNYSDTFTIMVTVNPLPVINAGKSNDIDCAALSANLFASGGTQYTWSPSTGLNNKYIPNPVATPSATQKYYVFVTTSNGCANSDSVTLFVNIAGSLGRYMPNAFTPNGDGVNDCYGIKSWVHVSQLQFMIYDRWGEKVFYTSNPNECWDGNYKGKKSLAGTYVYYIKAQTACGEVESRGTFILIR